MAGIHTVYRAKKISVVIMMGNMKRLKYKKFAWELGEAKLQDPLHILSQ